MDGVIILIAFALLIILLIGERLSGRSIAPLVISLAILVLGMILMAEIVWLGFVAFWGVRLSLRLRPRLLAAAPLLVAVVIIGCHLAGFKLLGQPALKDNRPLIESPLTLDRVAPPNVLIATDGSRHILRGVTFVAEMNQFPPDRVQALLGYKKTPLKFAATSDPAFPCGYVGESRIQYWCGNTWFPHFFPSNLPTHRKEDVGSIFRVFVAKDNNSEN
ncbi:hypothetical protein [Prosthecobacter sp.]|uniref:hypothetical protein n=1 Tax=Prosthecobacter sp. TaxID=1965333 RepID=UPI002ABAC39F|nr:hypothetical protein [Prosthecobacter sp.]MDZ4402673.1 hypothetical protein [Prosthecobacter sp.]